MTMIQEKKMNWQELKDFANTLNEDQLSQPVIWWGEERGGFIGAAFGLQEDYILGDEGYEPVSSWEPEDIEEDMERMEAGTPILSADCYDRVKEEQPDKEMD